MTHRAGRHSPDFRRPNLAICWGDDQPERCGMKMEETNLMPNFCLNLVLLGRIGVGKSSSGNTILRRQAFKSKKSSTSVTRDIVSEVGRACGLPITVYDTPGFSGTESEEELRKYEEVLQKCESRPSVFLLVIRAEGLTAEDQEIVEKLEKLLGEKHLKNSWILFTSGDKLEEENVTINELINETEALKKLTQKYEGKFHVFNNRTKGQSDQVKPLISKVFQKSLMNLSKSPLPRIPTNIQEIPVVRLSSRRIVLLGKTGVGKSTTGNTILDQEVFRSGKGRSPETHECSEKQMTVFGRSVSVVDTPPFFDAQMKPEEFMTEIMKSAYLSCPGPHAFLIVFPVNMKVTEEELKIPKMIEITFGEEVLKYSIILFSYGDQLRQNVEELIEENRALSRLVDQCGGRFHVFNNRDVNNRRQVNDLLQKIDTMVEQNGGGHYSNQMFQDAQRYRQEEREKIQQEVTQRPEETERVRKETEERIRAELEDQQKSKYGFLSYVGAAFKGLLAPITLSLDALVAVSRYATRAAAEAGGAAVGEGLAGAVGGSDDTWRRKREEEENKRVQTGEKGKMKKGDLE